MRPRNGVFPILFPALLCACAAFAQSANPAGLTMTRLHAPEYVPGQPLEIVLMLEAASAPLITAMGVQETIPEGWRLMEVRSLDDQSPAIHPEAGAGPWLEFAWMTSPPMPYRFSYTVWVPESEGGTKQVSGNLEYRLNDGPHYVGPVVTAMHGPEHAKPIILLKGDNPMIVRAGEPWSDPGCTAMDHTNTDITSRVVVSGAVDTNAPSEYQILYRVDSEDGSQYAEAVRVVRVVAGPETPAPPGAASPAPEPLDPMFTGGRERSNPLAAGTRDNPVAGHAGRPSGGAAGTDRSAPKKGLAFPDLSGNRPAPVESSDKSDEKYLHFAHTDITPGSTASSPEQARASNAQTPAASSVLAAPPLPEEAAAHTSPRGEQAARAQEPDTFPEKQAARSGLKGRALIAGMALLCLAGFGVAPLMRRRSPRNRQ